MDTQVLIYRLRLIQNRLYDLANDLGNLTDPEIVAVSEEADRLILQLQKLQMKEYGRRRHRIVPKATELFAHPQATEKVGQQSGALLLEHS